MSNPYVSIDRWRDQQYGAAFYLFACLRWADKRRSCFSFVVSGGIEKGKLLRTIRPWSHGEQILVKVALDLFDPGCVKENRGKPVDFGEAASVLDSGHIQHVINAVHIARGEAQVPDEVIARIMQELDQ